MSTQLNGHLASTLSTGQLVAAVYAELLADHSEAKAAGGGYLTEAGVGHVRLLAMLARRGGVVPVTVSSVDLPRWDGKGRRLWLGDRLLKEFRQPAENQTALLAAIQARGWVAGHLVDPLPGPVGEPEVETRERLHETIKSLNRGLPAGTVYFHGDGTGHGVRWEIRRSVHESNGSVPVPE